MKNIQGQTYLYDGSFIGFLSVLHTLFTEGCNPLSIQSAKKTRELLFTDSRYIEACGHKARSVWKALEGKGKEKSRLVYFSFLSESADIELLLYRYAFLLFRYSGPDRHDKLKKLSKHLEIFEQQVSREKQELEASLDFVQLEDGLLSVEICPHHNVLPLISKFYRNRYARRNWLISDSKRNYSLLSRNGVVELIPGEENVPAKKDNPGQQMTHNATGTVKASSKRHTLDLTAA